MVLIYYCKQELKSGCFTSSCRWPSQVASRLKLRSPVSTLLLSPPPPLPLSSSFPFFPVSSLLDIAIAVGGKLKEAKAKEGETTKNLNALRADIARKTSNLPSNEAHAQILTREKQYEIIYIMRESEREGKGRGEEMRITEQSTERGVFQQRAA